MLVITKVKACSRSNYKLEVLVFEECGKTGVSRKKTLRARERTNNKLNSHIPIMLKPGFGSRRMLDHEHAISVCAAICREWFSFSLV